MIDPGYSRIAVQRQCELLGLPRSSYYYRTERDDHDNVRLMHQIDEQFTRTPFYGVRRMTAWLRQQGQEVNPKRVRRLMRRMGLEAIYPKPRLSQAHPLHKKYPYLLSNLVVNRPNQVWSTDITYIRMVQGFVYLVAIMDWFSRYVLAWEVSITLDTAFCLNALDRALAIGQPEIFNTDQGSQFTSLDFIRRLEERGVQISMDGRGRVFDSIFVERLWRSVKYEEVYLHQYRTVSEAQQNLAEYFRFYNQERLHEALGYLTPSQLYVNELMVSNPVQALIMH